MPNPPKKLIKVICKGADVIPINDIPELQGNLKELSVVNFEKLRKSIEKHGFAFTFHIATVKGKPYGLIDGHQRLRTLKKMLEHEYRLSKPGLPVSFIDCKTKKQAHELILQAIAQYGKVTEDGLAEFIHMADIDLPDLEALDIPDFDIGSFIESQGPGDPEPPNDPPPEPKLTPVECPNCGHSFEIGLKQKGAIDPPSSN